MESNNPSFSYRSHWPLTMNRRLPIHTIILPVVMTDFPIGRQSTRVQHHPLIHQKMTVTDTPDIVMTVTPQSLTVSTRQIIVHFKMEQCPISGFFQIIR